MSGIEREYLMEDHGGSPYRIHYMAAKGLSMTVAECGLKVDAERIVSALNNRGAVGDLQEGLTKAGTPMVPKWDYDRIARQLAVAAEALEKIAVAAEAQVEKLDPAINSAWAAGVARDGLPKR